MELMYKDFKNLLESDQQLIKFYFRAEPGTLFLSPYGEVIFIKKEASAREYRKDPTLIPMLTSDLLIQSIERVLKGQIVAIEVKDDYIYMSIYNKELLALKVLKGYSLKGELFPGLLNIFLKILRDQDSKKVG